jgi:hypothetical protein
MLQGMVQAAAYIYRKLKQESLLERAFNWNVAEGTDKFPLVSIFLILFFFYILNPFLSAFPFPLSLYSNPESWHDSQTSFQVIIPFLYF